MGVRAIIAAACAWIACVGGAQAQTPPESHLVLAREIVELSGAADAMMSTMDQMAPVMIEDAVNRGLSRSDAERLAALAIEEFMADAPRLLELTAIAYAGMFTEQQLRDIRDFFASDTGRALAARTPELTVAMMRVGMVVGEEAALRAVERFTAERERSGDGPS